MHRTTSKTRSLSLQRETLRVLASSDLSSVQGGAVAAVVGTQGELVCHIDLPDIIAIPPRGSIAGNCHTTGTISISTVINPPIVRP